MQNKHCRVGSAIGYYAAMNKSVDSRQILLYTVYPVCTNILLLPSGTSAASYTCKISELKTTHYKWQPSSSTPINQNSDWPKPLHCDNTTNPPSAILSLHNLWGWVGGGREEGYGVVPTNVTGKQ